MMWGEQWICRCGTHNLWLREVCRECGAPRIVGEVSRESPFDVMGNVEKIYDLRYESEK